MKKGTLYLVVWIFLTLLALFGLLLTIVVAASPAQFGDTPWATAFFGICTGAFAVPAIVVFVLWWKESKRHKELEAVGAILRAYREIPIRELANRIGREPAVAETLAANAVSEGHAQGYVDHAAGMFYSGAVVPFNLPAAPPQVVVVAQQPQEAAPEVRYCRECGSRVSRVPGTSSWRCGTCGNVQ